VRRGHATTVADSGKAALWLLAREHIDVLVMDVFMPEMDGIELLREIKRRHPDVVVIGMTGSAEGFHDGLERLMTAMGAACLLHKPLDPSELTGALQNLS
jgi:CheY-like chemotaxis protein